MDFSKEAIIYPRQVNPIDVSEEDICLIQVLILPNTFSHKHLIYSGFTFVLSFFWGNKMFSTCFKHSSLKKESEKYKVGLTSCGYIF